MRILSLLVFFFTTTTLAQAYVPEVVVQKSLLDVVTIQDPTLAQTFYGDLSDFPHTYQIVATQPFHFFMQIAVPDIESSTNNISGILIKEPQGRGRVEEITRLYAKDAEWKSVREWWTMDSQRMGPFFEKDLGPGIYRFEVSTPNNHEKYVLKVGTREELTLGYFGTVSRLAGVKVFFEKSRVRVVESPLIFLPIIVLVGLGMWYRRRVRIMKSAIL